MNWLLALFLVLSITPAFGQAHDFRISDDDGDVLNINADGTIPIDGGVDLTAVDSSIYPATDNTYDLGSAAKSWKDIYADGTVYVGDDVRVDGAIYYGGGAFISQTFTGGRKTQVGCSDSIQTAVNNATAGDTLLLGSCEYVVSSGITIDKSIYIAGQGVGQTTIKTASAITILTTTADGFGLSDLSIYGTSSGAILGVFVDGRSGTGFDGKNIFLNNLYCEIFSSSTSAGASPDCFRLFDSGGNVNNVTAVVKSSGIGANSQQRGFVFDTYSTMDVDNTIYLQDVSSISTTESIASGVIARGVRIYNNANGDNPNDTFVYARDVNMFASVPDSAGSAGTNAFHVQGARITANILNSSLDGDGRNRTLNATKNLDLRCDDGAICNISNTSFVGGFWQFSNGTINREGTLNGSSVYLDQANKMQVATSGIAANSLIYAIGGEGGDASSTTSGTGGAGAGTVLTLGTGGVATAATTTGTGGIGGSFAFTAGTGGSQTTATSATNVGGAGGRIVLTAGTGGSAVNAGTTNTGGAGGSVYILPGSGGTGTTANGAAGNTFIGVGTTGAGVGNVSIGTTSSIALLTIGSTSPTKTYIDGTNDLIVKDAVEIDGALYVATGYSSGKASCWHSSGRIGYCSTQPDASGNCTCN